MIAKNKDDVKRFSTIVETLVRSKRITYIDAIILHCEETGIELELVPKLINPKIKKMLENEANMLKMLKRDRTTKRLK